MAIIAVWGVKCFFQKRKTYKITEKGSERCFWASITKYKIVIPECFGHSNLLSITIIATRKYFPPSFFYSFFPLVY